jgi:hypothetical protein
MQWSVSKLRTKIWVIVMTAFAFTYVFLLGGRALTMLAEPNPVAIAMGVGMMVFPLFAVWAILREIKFGIDAEKITKRALAIELPELELVLRPSGRATKESAALAFEAVKQNFDESQWTQWLLLSEAYEASGDRKRARESMRKAISLAYQSEAS